MFDLPDRGDSTTLLVGEGNFSFSVALLKRNGIQRGRNFVATSFESEQECMQKYGIDAKRNIEFLSYCNVSVLHGIDATSLKLTLNDNKPYLFERIIFQFPHTGRKASIADNRKLLKNFFKCASNYVTPDGCVIVTLCAGQGGTKAEQVQREHCNSWQIVDMAAYSRFVLCKVQPFDDSSFIGYRCTGRRNAGNSFRISHAVSHMFKLSDSLPVLMPDWVSIADQFENDNKQPSYIKERLELTLKSPETMPQLWLLEKIKTAMEPKYRSKYIQYSNILGGTEWTEQSNDSNMLKTEQNQFLMENLDTFMSTDKIQKILDCDLEKNVLYYTHYILTCHVKQEIMREVSPLCLCGLLLGFEIDGLDIIKEIEETVCGLANQDVSLMTAIKETFQISGSVSTLKDSFRIHSIVNVKADSQSDIGFLYSSTEQAFGKLSIIILNLDHLTVAVNSSLRMIPQSIWSLNIKTRRAVLDALHNKTEYMSHSLHPPYYTHDFSFWIEDDDESSSKKNFTKYGLTEVILSTADDVLKSLRLLESYSKDIMKLKQCVKKISLCYRVVYQSYDCALSKDDSMNLQEKVRSNLSQCFNITMR